MYLEFMPLFTSYTGWIGVSIALGTLTWGTFRSRMLLIDYKNTYLSMPTKVLPFEPETKLPKWVPSEEQYSSVDSNEHLGSLLGNYKYREPEHTKDQFYGVGCRALANMGLGI